MGNMSELLLGRNAMTGSVADADVADNINRNALNEEPLAVDPHAADFADPITLRTAAATKTTLSAEEIANMVPNDLVFAIRSEGKPIR